MSEKPPRIAIVGAGPVGLSAAILLGMKGLPVTVFERREKPTHLPQAHVVNTRTSEIFREMGVFEKLAVVASEDEMLRCVTWSASLAGTRFGTLRLQGTPEQKSYRRSVSPARTLNMAQSEVERVLLDHLRKQGGEVHFQHVLTGVAIEGEKGVLTIRDASGVEAQKTFDYVLACDGASSTVREALGIEMVGPPSLAHVASCYFRGDLNRYLGGDTGPVHFVAGPDFSATFISFDLKDTWALMFAIPPTVDRKDITGEFMLGMVRRAVGAPDVELELVSVGTWNMSAQVAAEFRKGPFFLMGDAAHRFPPTGGLGLNTGVQDAHNLAWKLDFVARGKTSEALLGTYEAERAPVAARNCAHSVKNSMQMVEVDFAIGGGVSFFKPVDPATVVRVVTPDADHGVVGSSPEAQAKRARIQQAIDNQRYHFDALKIELGYRYGEPDSGAIPADYDFKPGFESGGLLPHAWTPSTSATVSTLDAYDKRNVTLLVGNQAQGWDAFKARLTASDVSVVRLDADLAAVLVRPDGHVMWGGAEASDSACDDLLSVLNDLKSGLPLQAPSSSPRSKDAPMSDASSSITLGALLDGIRPTKLAHIVLRSDQRFEEVNEWYRNLLNAQIVYRDDMLCFMTYDDEHHRLANLRMPGMIERPPGTVGVDHVAFTYASLSDLLETYGRLKDKGILPILTINHGATTSIYYEDPDRNRVEIQVDNFESREELVEFARSGAFNLNPIGIAFDADRLLEQIRAGVPAKTLQAYPRQPPPVDPQLMLRLYQN